MGRVLVAAVAVVVGIVWAACLVAPVAVQGAKGYAVFDGSEELSVTSIGEVPDFVSSEVAPELRQRYSLFSRPTTKLTIIVGGMHPDQAAGMGIEQLGLLQGSLQSLESLPRPFIPSAPLNVHRVVQSLRSAGMPARFVRKSKSVELGEQKLVLSMESDAAMTFLRDLHTLSVLQEELSEREMTFLLEGLEHLAEELSHDDMEVARTAVQSLLKQFLGSMQDTRVVTSLLFNGDASTRSATGRGLLSSGVWGASYGSNNYVMTSSEVGAAVNGTSSPTPMEIAQYQAGVWTFIFLAVILAAFTIGTCNMSFAPDKFTRELFREEKQAI